MKSKADIFFDLQAEKKSKGNRYKLKIDGERERELDRAKKNFFPSWGFFPSLNRKREKVPHRFKRMSCFTIV